MREIVPLLSILLIALLMSEVYHFRPLVAPEQYLSRTLDPNAGEKALWVQAKRGVLAVLRVQPASDLVESLLQPVTEEHEVLWDEIVENELIYDNAQQQNSRRVPSTGVTDSAYRLEDIRS